MPAKLSISHVVLALSAKSVVSQVAAKFRNSHVVVALSAKSVIPQVLISDLLLWCVGSYEMSVFRTCPRMFLRNKRFRMCHVGEAK